MNDGRLPWDNIFNGEWQRLLPLRASVDYSVVSPSLDVQITTGADELLQHIMLNIPPKDQPFFTAELTDIQLNWSPDQILHSGILEVLKKDPIPVWAATPPMTALLTDLRQAYSTFIQVEASVKNIITQLSSAGTHPGMSEMPSTIMNLEAQEWPSRLAKAGEQLEKVCMAAAILPLPLLRLATTQAGNAVSLISQYKSTLDNLRLSTKNSGGDIGTHSTTISTTIFTEHDPHEQLLLHRENNVLALEGGSTGRPGTQWHAQGPMGTGSPPTYLCPRPQQDRQHLQGQHRLHLQ